MSTFFSALQAAGVQYSNLKNSGEAAGAAAAISQVRASTIDPFLAQANSGQDITMTSSQISTAGGGSLFILATGTLNVGTTLACVRQYHDEHRHPHGDRRRHQHFYRGRRKRQPVEAHDLSGWGHHGLERPGQHQRGKGLEDRDRCEPSPAIPARMASAREYSLPQRWEAASGPDLCIESEHARPARRQHLPLCAEGDIDAGEAGISGGTVVLGATAILNASNISFTTGSVGLPAASQGVSLGALTGTSDMSKSTISSGYGRPRRPRKGSPRPSPSRTWW